MKAIFTLKAQDETSEYKMARRGSRYQDHSPHNDGITYAPEDAHRPMPKSLSEILKDPQSRHKFRTFLKERHAPESLLFYDSVEMYQQIDNPKWRARAAEGIINKFVAELAPFQINISSGVRDRLMKTGANKWVKESFNEAKYEAYDLMKQNFFASFVAKEYLRGE